MNQFSNKYKIVNSMNPPAGGVNCLPAEALALPKPSMKRRSAQAGKLKINRGFTMLDLLVSIAIISLLTLTTVVSFIQTERSQNLANDAEVLASQLRELENMALSGKVEPTTGQVPAGGYGVYFKSDGSNISYSFFADMNRDLFYNTTVPLTDYFPYLDQEVTLKTNYPFHQDVYISKIFWKIGALEKKILWNEPSSESLNIIFKTPEAKVYVNGETTVNLVSIELCHQKIDKTKTIKIYSASRQISVE